MNLIDIYKRLRNAKITGESIDYNRGFFDAVELLKMALQKYEHINLRIENTNLRRKLLVTDINLDKELKKLKHRFKQRRLDVSKGKYIKAPEL